MKLLGHPSSHGHGKFGNYRVSEGHGAAGRCKRQKWIGFGSEAAVGMVHRFYECGYIFMMAPLLLGATNRVRCNFAVILLGISAPMTMAGTCEICGAPCVTHVVGFDLLCQWCGGKFCENHVTVKSQLNLSWPKAEDNDGHWHCSTCRPDMNTSDYLTIGPRGGQKVCSEIAKISCGGCNGWTCLLCFGDLHAGWPAIRSYGAAAAAERTLSSHATEFLTTPTAFKCYGRSIIT